MSALGTKLRHRVDTSGTHYIGWYCPGCKHAHSIRVRVTGAESSWTVSGTPEEPVFSPSVHCSYTPEAGGTVTTCHCFVGGAQGQCPGLIEFLADSPHELAGQTVPMVPWPANYGGL